MNVLSPDFRSARAKVKKKEEPTYIFTTNMHLLIKDDIAVHTHTHHLKIKAAESPGESNFSLWWKIVGCPTHLLKQYVQF